MRTQLKPFNNITTYLRSVRVQDSLAQKVGFTKSFVPVAKCT